MTVPKRQFVNGPYGQIHLRRAGVRSTSKRPVLCLHMFPQSGRNFEKLLSLVSDDRLIVAPDFPGYGESAAPVSPIRAQDYANAIWSVVNELDLLSTHGSIDIFGIHAGAKLAVELAFQKPEQVHKIMLSSAAVLYQQELDQLRSVFNPIPLDENGTRFQHLWQLLVEHRGEKMSLEMMAKSFAEMLRGGESYEWGHHAVFEYNQVFPEIIQQLPHEIILLNPNDDLHAMTPRTEAYLKNGHMMTFEDWGQGFLETDADQLLSIMCSFFDAAQTHDELVGA